MVRKILNLNETQPTALIEDNNTYYIAELRKTENIQKNIKDEFVKNNIILDLSKKTKRKLTAEIGDKINKNNFKITW